MKNADGTGYDEQETRQRLKNIADSIGCTQEYANLLVKYDRLIRTCKNASEKKHISIMGAVEVHKLFGFENALVVDGVEIIPAAPSYALRNKQKIG